MVDAFPNIDEFGRGATTCLNTNTGCAVCATADVMVRFGKSIPRLSDGTPDMITLGRRMGARHRAVDDVRHGRSLDDQCYGGTNWCTYCAFLELRAHGIVVVHKRLSWEGIEAQLRRRHAIILPGRYGRIPVVSEASYSGTKPARGRSDTGFTLEHMVVAWQIHSFTTAKAIKDIVVSDSDFGSKSRPTVPPHSIISRAALRSFWEALGWSVCIVNQVPPALVVPPPAWWGSDVPADLRAAYTANQVAGKLRSLGIDRWGVTINLADVARGLRQRKIAYGTSVQLPDLKALMKKGTGK